MTRILLIKTGALGDVLRTTSILEGLTRRHSDLELTWVVSHAARPLVEHHPLVHRVEPVDPENTVQLADLTGRLSAAPWDRVLSFDDETGLAALASAVPTAGEHCLSGAHLPNSADAPSDGGAAGKPVYTDDVSPWFDMGLLSRHGKQEADRLKIANRATHPQIFAAMLGIEPGRPELRLPAEVRERAAIRALTWDLDRQRPLIGLNTGAGGRWRGKELDIDRTLDLAQLLHSALNGAVSFLLLGGPEEKKRNATLLAGFAERPDLRVVDGGSSNSLLDFAALVGLVDLLLASDSLAMHMGIALGRRIVCFFAPTSAAEIELYGQGEKVQSSAPDYCSYRSDASSATITPAILCSKILEVLSR